MTGAILDGLARIDERTTQLRRMVAVQTAKLLIADGSEASARTPASLAKRHDDPSFVSWFSVGRSFRANRDAFEDTLQSDHRLKYWSRARRSRDLPIATRTGGFMTRDLSIWMRTIGSNPYAMREAERRTYRRGILRGDVMERVRPPCRS